jgi:hypothetical protein
MIQPATFTERKARRTKMATYFDGDTLQSTLMIQLVMPALKLEMPLLHLHMLYFKTLLGYMKINNVTSRTKTFA